MKVLEIQIFGITYFDGYNDIFSHISNSFNGFSTKTVIIRNLDIFH